MEPIAKNFSSTSEYTFPVGDGTTYKYSALTPTSANTVTMRLIYFRAKSPINWRYNSPLYKVSQAEYWDIYNTFFTLGTLTSDNPLPVERTHFSELKDRNSVELSWATATEIKSDYFSIIKSNDVIKLHEIGQIDAAGFSFNLLEYYDIGNSPYKESNYYKLINYDEDGSLQESETKVVHFDGNSEKKLYITSNPTHSTQGLTLAFMLMRKVNTKKYLVLTEC